MAKKEVENNKSLESWIWDAACAIRGAKDAGKFKDYILPLIFIKRLCDVFDDEVNRIAKGGSKAEALKKIDADHSRVRFYIPLKAKDPETQDTWSVIRSLSNNIGENLTKIIRDIAANNSLLDGVIDSVDYNATTRGEREIDDDRLSNLIEAISQKRLGLNDVEPDIIGRSYEYLIRKFAEGSGQSAGEFYTPREVGLVMAYIMDAEPGMEVYDPACGSAGLLIKCELVLKEKQEKLGKKTFAPLRLYGQESISSTWAMAKMNMVIHDMEGDIELGDTFNNPKFKDSTGHGIKKFDLAVANPMWNQPGFNEELYTNDAYHRFPAGNPGGKADWGWVQHILSSLKDNGRAAVVLDTGAASRGSGNANTNKEKEVRKWFVEHDLIEGVLYLPENLFYNTTAPGIVIFLNKNKPAKLKELKRSMMNHLFTHGTKGEPTKMTEIGEVPESWEIVELGHHLQKTTSKDPSENPSEEFSYIDVSSVSRDLFKIVSVQKLLGKEAPSRARKQVETGDIIFATVRPTLQRIAIIPKELNDQICSTGYCVLRVAKGHLDRDFLFHYLCSETVLKYVDSFQRGANYPAISDGVLFEMPIPFPPSQEQIKIGSCLNSIDQKLETSCSKLAAYQRLFKTLLHELMSGERRVAYDS